MWNRIDTFGINHYNYQCMPYRRLVLADNEVYHIFNRSVANEQVFSKKKDLERAISLFDYYRYFSIMRYSFFIRLDEKFQETAKKRIRSLPPLVEILSFTLMPNHYHLLVKQLKDNGVSIFVSNFQNSFARYFNTKNQRKGSLFCEMFKAVWIESNEQLIHTSRYIHLNPVSGYLMEVDRLVNYPYTSFAHYSGRMKYDFVSTDLVLSSFKDKEAYKQFVFNQADYQRSLEKIKHLLFEK